MQQIQVFQRAEGRPLADHPEARFQQRLIVGAAIVGNQHFELFQVLMKSTQLTSLLPELAHEKLPDAKALRRDAAHSDQKSVCSRASRQACSFRIEKTPFGGRNTADQAI